MRRSVSPPPLWRGKCLSLSSSLRLSVAIRASRKMTSRSTHAGSAAEMAGGATMTLTLVARRHDNGRPQAAALDIGRLEVQQAIQLAVKAAPMRCDRAVGEIGAPVPDRAGILQERLELRCEDRVAVIDRVLRITDQMGE